MDGLGIGRIVHFTDEVAECQAAVVTHVHDKLTGLVNLHVIPPHGSPRTLSSVGYAGSTPTPYRWHWTERA